MPDNDLPDDWRDQIVSWERQTNAVDELWLFGSRAKGISRPESDVDIALSLMPAQGDHDWALGDYFALATAWQGELEAIVSRHVSLTAIVPDTPGDTEVRSTGRTTDRSSTSWKSTSAPLANAAKPSPRGPRSPLNARSRSGVRIR